MKGHTSIHAFSASYGAVVFLGSWNIYIAAIVQTLYCIFLWKYGLFTFFSNSATLVLPLLLTSFLLSIVNPVYFPVHRQAWCTVTQL